MVKNLMVIAASGPLISCPKSSARFVVSFSQPTVVLNIIQWLLR